MTSFSKLAEYGDYAAIGFFGSDRHPQRIGTA